MKLPVSLPRVALLLLSAILAMASPVLGIPHVPQSSHAISDNGRYRLDCISEGPKPPQFKLTDLEGRKVLWSQERDRDEEATAIFVHDDGRSVVKNLNHGLSFTNAKGEITGKVHLVDDAFTDEERDSYINETTAGPLWADNLALYYFLEDSRRLLFVVRPWWGRQLLMDFDRGELIVPTRKITAMCKVHEEKLALRDLERALENPDTIGQRFNSPILPALLVVGQLASPEAAPLLEKIQDHTNEYTAEGKAVDLALRRLGEEPKRGVSRDEKRKGLKVGMGRMDVLKQMHFPDFGIDEQWEYDIDTEQPFTLIIKWDEAGEKVVAIEETDLPLWSGKSRDQQMVDGDYLTLRNMSSEEVELLDDGDED